MAKFRVEVMAGDESSGDVLEVEAVNADAAVEIAARQIAGLEGAWSVIGVVS